jgi:hypothetical protein
MNRILMARSELESGRTGFGDKEGPGLDFESLFSPRYFMFGVDQGQIQDGEALLS